MTDGGSTPPLAFFSFMRRLNEVRSSLSLTSGKCGWNGFFWWNGATRKLHCWIFWHTPNLGAKEQEDWSTP